MKASARQVILVVAIPYPLLKAWHGYMDGLQKHRTQQKKTTSDLDSNSPSCPCNHCCDSHQTTYVDLFEYSIPGNMFAINDDENIRAEVNKSLARLVGLINSEYAKARSGHKREQLNCKSRKFHIFEGMTASVKDLMEECEMAKDELEQWKSQCLNLQERMKNLYEEMKTSLAEKDYVIQELKDTQVELKNYIQQLENNDHLKNKRKDVGEVKNKSRKLKTFLSHAKTTLWFSESFCLELQSLTLKELRTEKYHEIRTEEHACISESGGFDGLSDKEKENIEQVLFLLDRFCVSDHFYHELTMISDGLPKSYLIKQRRKQLNYICHITRTPGNADGAQVSFTNLLEERISDLIAKNENVDMSHHPIQVKISGDGARMTRNSSFIPLSFALLQTGSDVMSASGNHTIAVVRGSESHDTLKESFQYSFEEINELIEKKTITINDTTFDLEFFSRRRLQISFADDGNEECNFTLCMFVVQDP